MQLHVDLLLPFQLLLKASSFVSSALALDSAQPKDVMMG
jgi:hypothetical protein